MADYFGSKGWGTHLLINDYGFTEKAVRNYDYEKISFKNINEEIEATERFLAKEPFDVIVIDLFEKCQNHDLMRVFETHAQKVVVAVTDGFDKVNIKADIVIASHPKQTQYEYTGNKQKVLAGEQHFIVAPEFIEKKISIRRKVENVLITFGGHDSYNVTLSIARYILALARKCDLSAVKFNFLVGGIYGHEEELMLLLKGGRIRSAVHKNLYSVLPLFLESDVAITAGGNTLYELCNIGVPCIVVALNDRQDEACRVLYDKNLIEYAGYYSEIGQSIFDSIFLRLLDSYENRANLHNHCTEHFKLNPLNEIYLLLIGKNYEA